MSKKEKRIEQLRTNPTSLTYKEIESLFIDDEYCIEWWKWSHKLIFNKQTWQFATIPIHWWDCKDYYKNVLKVFYFSTHK